MRKKDQTRRGIAANVVLALYRLGTLVLAFFLAWSAYTYGFSSLFGSDRDYILPFLIIWFVTAYVVLPRVHRFLTSVYIPDYFIGRTRTPDGFYSDPINAAFFTDEATLRAAFTKAGWTEAEQLTWRSSLQMALRSFQRKSYPEAPVSALYLFGRRQDIAFQQEINGNPRARHHVRFWKTPDDWYLPGGFKADWIAAGTYDKSVGFSLFTLQITHKIGEHTDDERDHIIDTLQKAGVVKSVDMKKHFTEAFHSRNGGGDRIQTDGSLPFIEL